jgi:hypothetical protein
MSKENLDSYELFFAEIPQNIDYLSEIIRKDSALEETPQPESSPSLSPEQVERLAKDSLGLPDSNQITPTYQSDNLFSQDI